MYIIHLMIPNAYIWTPNVHTLMYIYPNVHILMYIYPNVHTLMYIPNVHTLYPSSQLTMAALDYTMSVMPIVMIVWRCTTLVVGVLCVT